MNKLFPPEKRKQKAHPWIGTQYSDTTPKNPWFTRPAGQAHKKPKTHGVQVPSWRNHNKKNAETGASLHPYWTQTQQQYENERLQVPSQVEDIEPKLYQNLQPATYPNQQKFSYQQSSYQEPLTIGYQGQQPTTDFMNQQQYSSNYKTTTDYNGAMSNQFGVPKAQLYSTAQKPAYSAQPVCPASCAHKCTTGCSMDCCSKDYNRAEESEQNIYVSGCPRECRQTCSVHCPQKCCGLNLCPVSCRKSCVPSSCPKKCCSILKEYLPPIAATTSKLAVATCASHCMDKCSTDCPQACCTKSKLPNKTTKCPSVCSKVSKS